MVTRWDRYRICAEASGQGFADILEGLQNISPVVAKIPGIETGAGDISLSGIRRAAGLTFRPVWSDFEGARAAQRSRVRP